MYSLFFFKDQIIGVGDYFQDVDVYSKITYIQPSFGNTI